MAEKDTHLTITLTGRAPVRIVKADWPIIACSHHQSGEIAAQSDHWNLYVRQHQDGRTLVYGVYQSQWGNIPDRRGGQIVEPGEDVGNGKAIVAAIYQVAEYLDFNRQVADECIADLPAQEIV